VTFPTNSFSPVQIADDLTGNQNLTITVPSSCHTLIAFVGDPSDQTGTSQTVTWDPTGANQALTRQGSAQLAGDWGDAQIFILQNPTPGTSKTLALTGTSGNQIAFLAVGWDESVSIISNSGATNSAPGSGAFDSSITGITTQAGDAVISMDSDDGGKNESTTAPTWSTGTTYGAVATGSGDSWGVAGVTIAGGTSTTITLHYPASVSAFGHLALKYVVLRNAAAPTINTQPADQYVYAGRTATFTISATSSGGTLHYQWKKNGSNVGTDSSTYAPVAAVSDNGAIITCVVSDDNGSVTSMDAHLFVYGDASVAWWKA